MFSLHGSSAPAFKATSLLPRIWLYLLHSSGSLGGATGSWPLTPVTPRTLYRLTSTHCTPIFLFWWLGTGLWQAGTIWLLYYNLIGLDGSCSLSKPAGRWPVRPWLPSTLHTLTRTLEVDEYELRFRWLSVILRSYARFSRALKICAYLRVNFRDFPIITSAWPHKIDGESFRVSFFEIFFRLSKNYFTQLGAFQKIYLRGERHKFASIRRNRHNPWVCRNWDSCLSEYSTKENSRNSQLKPRNWIL